MSAIEPQDEKELLEELRSQPSVAAWGRVYDLLASRLRLFTYSLIRLNQKLSPDDAEDIVHEVLTRFVKNFQDHRSSIRTFGHLRNYLFKACRNEVASRLRHTGVRDGARQLLELSMADILTERSNAALKDVENKKTLEQLFANVGPECQKLLHFYIFEGGTLTEYATSTGKPTGTVYSQWHRCLGALKGSATGKTGQ